MVVNVFKTLSGNWVLLSMHEVTVTGGVAGDQFKALLFNDRESTITLCRHAWARANKLTGRPGSLYIKVLEEKYEEIYTKEYTFNLLTV